MLNLVVISQERKILETECDSVTIPTQSGIITVLPKHAPLFSLLQTGEVVFKTAGSQPTYLLVSGGFVSVNQNRVALLTDFGVRSEEIDEKAILEAKTQAEQAMKEKLSDEAMEKARADFLHAELQLAHLQRRRHSNSPRPNSSNS